MNRRKLLKVIIPICLILIVAGVWMFKNVYNGSEDLETPANEEDFSLETASIDLDALKEYNLPIIIDFGADWCAPCQEMAPVLEKLNGEMQGKAIIKFVDVSENEDAAKEFPIRVIPTQIFVNSDGKPYVPSDDMQIEFDIYYYEDTGEHALTVHEGMLTESQMRDILSDMGVDE